MEEGEELLVTAPAVAEAVDGAAGWQLGSMRLRRSIAWREWRSGWSVEMAPTGAEQVSELGRRSRMRTWQAWRRDGQVSDGGEGREGE